MSEANLKPATFTVDEKELQFPRVSASVGNDGVQIASLLRETGLVTLDPGFMNTANTESQITYIDGDQGILRYRGYPIDQLAEQSTFLEVAYLLIYGELPSAEELSGFEERINHHALLHENFQKFFTAFPLAAHPMSVLQAGVAGIGTYNQDTLDPFDPKQLELAAVLLLAQVPTMIAAIAKRAAGQPQLYPDTSLGYVEDFLRMTFALPYQDREVDPVLVDALDMLLILHADHEQNCST
ncbi:MAG TPA: citrate/2-methylcitrate synthase, partial [Beutenbergiaceae bacterium]|nr:citrate/2-methylcitrate synthase [Beutenbergiaceae bacterium]